MELYLPNINNSYYPSMESNTLIGSIQKPLYFVFGSNLAGRHGLGAAKTAVRNYGAKMGIGEGLIGLTYAIPTKDRDLNVRSLAEIKQSVDKFIELSHKGNYCFYVTPIGTGYAGYRHEDIAPLFKEARNCWLPDVWAPILNKPKKIIIAGSRSIKDYDLLIKYFKESGLQASEIVSGGAQGVDTMEERLAAELNIPVKRFIADWDTHGKKAGYLRNEQMAEYGTALLAIWDGKSPGTRHMVERAKKHHFQIWVKLCQN